MKCFQNNTPITAADALYDLCFRCLGGREWVIASCTDAFSTPEYLKGQKVLGVLHVQDGEDMVQGPSIFVVEDYMTEGNPEAMVRELLEVDSCGTGNAVRPEFEPTKGILFKTVTRE